jgi:hypothetical protein
MFTYLRCKISNEDEKDPCWVGPLSPQHGVSSGYGWRVAVNILNKQSQTAEKGWSSSLGGGGLGMGLTTLHHKKLICYEMFQSTLDLN